MVYTAKITWRNNDVSLFVTNKYSRVHQWTFDGGLEIMASSSPSVVPIPFSEPSALDPEEAFVASLASCHMLWFLSIAAKNNVIVISYIDDAKGFMTKNERGQLYISTVELRPHVVVKATDNFEKPMLEHLHELAHQACFIANSVRSEIILSPVFDFQ